MWFSLTCSVCISLRLLHLRASNFHQIWNYPSILQIFFCFFTLSGILITFIFDRWYCLIVPWTSFFSVIFPLCFISDSSYRYDFKFTNFFSCTAYCAVNLFRCIFHVRYFPVSRNELWAHYTAFISLLITLMFSFILFENMDHIHVFTNVLLTSSDNFKIAMIWRYISINWFPHLWPIFSCLIIILNQMLDMVSFKVSIAVFCHIFLDITLEFFFWSQFKLIRIS